MICKDLRILVKCVPEFWFFTVFLKNRTIISKIKRSKVTYYAALTNKIKRKKAHSPIFVLLLHVVC